VSSIEVQLSVGQLVLGDLLRQHRGLASSIEV
jgi:hypothetical protein